VRSDSFAGVERYVSMVAPRLAARGCDVMVVGGDPAHMALSSDVVGWRPASTTWQVARELKRLGRLDVVHAHMTAAEIAAVITKPHHHARLVTTLHFAIPRGSGGRRGLLMPVGWLMDEQIAISEFVAATVHSNRVLLNGVETTEPGPSRRDRRVLVMQRLEKEKHTDVALRAWSVSGLRNCDWTLVIAGRGTQLSQLKQLAIDLNLSRSVEWAGFIDDPTQLLARSALLLAPAPAEPFGLTVVEAMARATPVIAANGGAHPETVGADGWLFPPGDAVACARLLDSIPHRDLEPYGAHLRSRQLELFDIEAHTDRLLKVYVDLAGSTRRSGSAGSDPGW
jgi:glycosyltransferase involved in cell wall biosynthesis